MKNECDTQLSITADDNTQTAASLKEGAAAADVMVEDGGSRSVDTAEADG